MALTDRALPGLHEGKIMKRLMNKIRQARLARKAAVGIAASLYLGLALVPLAEASDTEVYARKLEVTTTLTPTLMMMIDTSGSMNDCMVYASNGTTCTQTRIQVLLSAMQKILYGSTADNVKRVPGYVKMGYARYNPDANKGGWVRYPARPLDAFVDISPDGSVQSTVTVGSGDAQQQGSLDLTSGELSIGAGDVGLQFPAVAIPKGASINDAYIEFTASRDSALTPATWEIRAQSIASAPVFSASNDISSRTYSSVAAVEVVSAQWLKNSKYQVSVVEPIKDLVNQSYWCGGSDLVLRLRRPLGNSVDRYAYSYEGSAANAPRLVVSYSIDPQKSDSCIVAPFTARAELKATNDDIEYTEGDSGNKAVRNASFLSFAAISSSNKRNQVAMRFSGFDREIYKNATIDSANIIVTGYKNVSNVPTLNVSAFDTDNLAPFSCTSSTTCAVPTTGLTAEQTWTLPSNKVIASGTHVIPVTSLAQGLVNRAGWQPTNAMGFMVRSSQTVSAKSSSAAFLSYEGASVSARPILEIKGRQTFIDLSKLKTVRDQIWEELQNMPISGGTPLGAAYVETLRYMLGLPVFVPDVDPRVTTDATLTRYKTPIVSNNQCAGNYVFALTDGEPNNLAQVGSNTPGITGQTCPSSYSAYVYGTQQSENWRCMLAAAEWALKPTNQVKARIRTNTVLFGDTDVNTTGNMAQVAKFGGGNFYKAGDEASLVNALTETVNALLDVSGTITAPGVAVNQLNRLNNLDQLFYAVFDPDVQRAYWPGNVKRYRLDIKSSDVYDVNGATAVDPATSFFKSTAQSWWSPSVDGDKARLGGAASVLPDPATRKLFTYTGGMPSSGSSLTPVDLGNSSFVSAGKTLTGVTDSNEFANLINWYKGYQMTSLTDGLVSVDSSTLRRQEMGGALHSRPILVNYGYSGDPILAATNPDLQDNVLFFSTMEGTLHAVDAKTGLEQFGFIPGEKLAVLPKLYANPSQTNPEFGMDLTWSTLRKDADGNGIPEKVYVYGGMRMGGSNYYALDVTSRTSPRLLFAIKGGSGAFTNLGQTWSQPVVASMRVNGTVTNVLVFGGGYDPQNETENNVFANDTVGNSIYIVNAETGALIWSGSSADNADMKFSIPSQPKTIDVDGDGLVDNIYFGDMGGQVFRIDLDNRATATSLVVRVKTLAKLGQTDAGGGSVTTQRRFFEPPTVALFKDAAGKVFAAVGLGSGYRSHPLNESTTDKFFVLFDYDVPRMDILTSSSLQSTIGMADLANVSPGATVTVSIAGKKGWYIDFPDTGEKVITSAVFFQNTLIFSSYVPSVEGGDSCAPVIGRSKLYRVAIANGLPTGMIVKDNSVQGLGGDPQLIVLPNSTDSTKSDIGIVTGTDVETFGSGVSAGLRRTRWMEKVKQ